METWKNVAVSEHSSNTTAVTIEWLLISRLSLLLLAIILFLTLVFPPSALSHPEHIADAYTEEGNNFASEGKWAEAAEAYEEAIEHGMKDPATAYICATFYMRAGNENQAFAYLDSAITFDYTNVQRLQYDKNFSALHDDPRWSKTVTKMNQAQEAYLARLQLNRDIFFLWKATVYDHSIAADTLSPTVVATNDSLRAIEVVKQRDAQQLKVADDYYTAARILYYSTTPELLTVAEGCIKEAVALSPETITYSWFEAYVTDKRLRSEGKPQIYGTQVSQDEDGDWHLDPVDETVISDSLRTRIGLPTLSEFRAQIEQENNE